MVLAVHIEGIKKPIKIECDSWRHDGSTGHYVFQNNCNQSVLIVPSNKMIAIVNTMYTSS